MLGLAVHGYRVVSCRFVCVLSTKRAWNSLSAHVTYLGACCLQRHGPNSGGWRGSEQKRPQATI
jgi:hypothetical protein